MEALNEIAATGSPAIMTVLGMGTVFVCLGLLYAITRVIGTWLPRLLALVEPRPPTEAVAPASRDESADVPATPQDSAIREDGLVAAMTLVLARHRSSRATAVFAGSPVVDAWKIAGRMRTLRDR